MTTTLIQNADTVVAWDDSRQRHVYMRNTDLAFRDGQITHIGAGFAAGPDCEVVDGRGMMLMPGLVDIHSHLVHEPINKGYTDETGSAGLYNSNLYEYMPTMEGDAEAAPHQLTLACAELLMSGVTTVVDMSVIHEEWITILAKSGLRAYLAPMFRSARWYTRNGHVVEYDWNEKGGYDGLERALKLIDRAQAHESGRLQGMLCPAQIDTCSADLLRDSRAEAKRRGIGWQTHAAQSLPEFHEITRRHGLTPVQWLHSLGVLDPASIVGHGIFVDDHPNTHWSTAADLPILAETGASVAHCPTVFMRRGMALRDFGRYRRAGINLGIGTDTYPHNMIEEMRHVGYLARLMAQTPRATTTGEVFHAATVGGAQALGRKDIGRLAVGARADLVLVDMTHHLMRPSRDPVRSLVYAAADRAVHTVYIDGRRVVHKGEVASLDYRHAAAEVDAAQRRAEALVPERDLVAHRSALEMSPLSFDQV
ncbi:amidohydrolase family protein [Bordetella hinzii CA90 BAL1384]|uniref:amidohydrolase family protein n=1 Tax=Bordetella hinzii TaxID=103855 RepID=UPI00045B8B18|nr:amidohydrolase family protein [Bordetella hinzii]KCB28254.1 amidohydrolase family protein [Bordetella hinzii CA90 BAL1384]KCB50960.1 amidohydrolase family protein [Bordetella hinzii 1277]QDJ47920.1 N-ethylammeline chlorohydrolase [Bordetella hinzii]WPL80669.1 amidohydrolase family protein [Bordetella hinzii]